MTNKDNAFAHYVMEALRKAGQHPEFGYFKGGTDGSMSGTLLGTTTLDYSGMEEKHAHTSEDMVSIDMMLESIAGFICIACELFGLEPEMLIERHRS